MITRSDKYSIYIKDYPSYSTAEQTFYEFPNGHGASVIHGSFTRGVEVAAIKWYDCEGTWNIDYSIPTTDNVFENVEDLDCILDEIYDLPVNLEKYNKEIALSEIEDIIYRENTFVGLRNALAEYLKLEEHQ